MLLCAAALYLPFPLTCVVLLWVAVWPLTVRELRQRMFRQKGVRLLLASVILLLVVPLFHRWWIGAVAGVGLAAVLLFYLFARAVLETAENAGAVFGMAMDCCCLGSVSCFLIGVGQKLVLGAGFRSTAGLLNANYYGCMIEFILLVCVYRLITNPKHYRFYVLILVMNTVAIFLCDCQSVWLAVIGGILVSLLLNGYRRWGALFGVAAVVLLAVILTFPGLLPRLDRLPETFATRLEIWMTAWKGFLAHPVLGQGLLAYLHVGERLGGYRTYHAHSLYLDPLLTTGIVGVSLTVCYLAGYLRDLYRRFKARVYPSSAVLIFATVTALLIHGVTDIPIVWVQTGGMLLLLLAGSAMNPGALAGRRADRKGADSVDGSTA